MLLSSQSTVTVYNYIHEDDDKAHLLCSYPSTATHDIFLIYPSLSMELLWAYLFTNFGVMYEAHAHANLVNWQHISPVNVDHVFINHLHIYLHIVVIIMVTFYWNCFNHVARIRVIWKAEKNMTACIYFWIYSPLLDSFAHGISFRKTDLTFTIMVYTY